MVERTIRPKDDEWKKALGAQEDTGANTQQPSQQPSQPASQLEQAASAAGAGSYQAGSPSKAVAAYPLQLKLNLTSYLYQLLKAQKDLPQTPQIQGFASAAKGMENPIAYAHAKLLADNLGPEGFIIRNISIEQQSTRSAPLKPYKFGSEFATQSAIPAQNVRDYVTALCGPDALKSPFASDLANAQLEDMVDVTSVPMLLPHLPEVGFLAKLPQKAVINIPFNSPYFIVMEMQPPTTRLIVAKAMAAAYQTGQMEVPQQQMFPLADYTALEGYPSKEAKQIFQQRQEIPVKTLQTEAQRHGAQDLARYMQAYDKAWRDLSSRLK